MTHSNVNICCFIWKTGFYSSNSAAIEEIGSTLQKKSFTTKAALVYIYLVSLPPLMNRQDIILWITAQALL
jgi:hypothetical protein